MSPYVRNAAAAAIASLGGVFLLGYLTYVRVNEAYLQVPTWLVLLGFAFVSVLSIGLVYGSYRVARSDFTADQGWQVVIWCFAGLLAALALTFWPIFYQRVVGVAVEDPLFILLVSAGLGANAGAVAGVSQVRSRQQLGRAQQARDSLEFLHRLLRHNVLNAVNVIHGNAELLVDRADSEATAERARTVCEQSERIDSLVQDTKAFIRQIEADHCDEAVDLSAIVADELESLRNAHGEASLECDLSADVDVRADPLVSAVVRNLLENAIVHNDCDTPNVEVTLETRSETATLRVADDGPGIPETEREAVTEPGEHGDHGLGLYLVETLVTRYDGTISFEDNEPRGTVVEIELPLA